VPATRVTSCSCYSRATPWPWVLPWTSEAGCGVASASDVAPVARLAGVLQFLALVEPLLGCNRQVVVPLATEVGLLDAPDARLPPPLGTAGKLDTYGNGGTARWGCATPALVVNKAHPGEGSSAHRHGHGSRRTAPGGATVG